MGGLGRGGIKIGSESFRGAIISQCFHRSAIRPAGQYSDPGWKIYFDDLIEELPILVLDETRRRSWSGAFDARSTAYFNLPNDSGVQVEQGVHAGDGQPGLSDCALAFSA